MVAIDSGLDSGRQPILNIKLPLAFFIGAAAALIGLGAMVVNDFSESGLRLASELDWRFTCLVFSWLRLPVRWAACCRLHFPKHWAHCAAS